ncbi:unnamed protein product [Moneuplotes crassus]|uniref:Uncharacterized protein n=1 Tax=Euplotes crassus TaxID=5936 RepID=A0AAD1U9M8_EUPCR|nr:unnamed protein product [Moneuplotes crassus]
MSKFEQKTRIRAEHKTQRQPRHFSLKKRFKLKSKLCKIKRRALMSPNQKNLSFFCRRRKVSKMVSKNNSFSMASKDARKSVQKRRKLPKVTLARPSDISAKSPAPKPSINIFDTAVDQVNGNNEQRYMTIIQKVQNAVGKRQSGFNSPNILKRFLSGQSLSNTQGYENEDNVSPRAKDLFSLDDISQTSKPCTAKNLNFRGKLIKISCRKWT